MDDDADIRPIDQPNKCSMLLFFEVIKLEILRISHDKFYGRFFFLQTDSGGREIFEKSLCEMIDEKLWHVGGWK